MYSSYRWDKIGKLDESMVKLGIESISMLSEGGSEPRTIIKYTDGKEEILDGDVGKKRSAEILAEISRIEREDKINKILKSGS